MGLSPFRVQSGAPGDLFGSPSSIKGGGGAALQTLLPNRLSFSLSRVEKEKKREESIIPLLPLVADRGERRSEEEGEPCPEAVSLELANLEEVEVEVEVEEVEPGSGGGGEETAEQRNKFLVLRLYEALNGRDYAAVQALLAPDLEWWFHGPPKHQQHMMRLLTGGRSSSFRFVPRSVEAFGSTVIAESQPQQGGGVYWVHAWTVGPDGVITQLREYFNTDLTVTRLAAATPKCKCVWQSRRPDSNTNSLPGLLLAI